MKRYVKRTQQSPTRERNLWAAVFQAVMDVCLYFVCRKRRTVKLWIFVVVASEFPLLYTKFCGRRASQECE